MNNSYTCILFLISMMTDSIINKFEDQSKVEILLTKRVTSFVSFLTSKKKAP